MRMSSTRASHVHWKNVPLCCLQIMLFLILICLFLWLLFLLRSSEDGQFCWQEASAGSMQEHRVLWVSSFIIEVTSTSLSTGSQMLLIAKVHCFVSFMCLCKSCVYKIPSKHNSNCCHWLGHYLPDVRALTRQATGTIIEHLSLRWVPYVWL